MNVEHFQRANSAKGRLSVLCDSSSGQSLAMCETHGNEVPGDNFPGCPREIQLNAG